MVALSKRKLGIMVWGSVAIVALAVAYNVASVYFMPDIEAYIARRVYYESVISNKGLSMHKAKHWKESE